MSDLCPTPEIETALKRYVEIQATEKELKEEKQALQKAIADYMIRAQVDQWYPSISGEALKISRSTRVKVEYDEGLLKERLGQRFVKLLVPDAKKMAQYKAEVHELLEPMMDSIGRIDREQVRSAVEQGVIRKEEFAGAFKKTERPSVTVSRDRRNEGA
jgi:hypothetical protein